MPEKTCDLKTTVGTVSADILSFTVGRDLELDRALVDADCIGTAAHVTMLARMPLRPPVLSRREARRVVRELVRIMRAARAGRFQITMEDQDVHLAVERELTARLGDVGKKVHTGRSRNDQVAVDLRLYAKAQLLDAVGEALELAQALLRLARTRRMVPMVGRTHMQPAMPSTVGLWASAHAESLLDDVALLRGAYELNDSSPLGAAASYGVPLPIDRHLTAKLLGFRRPVHNVLYANNARGKIEAVILGALAQAMLSLSRLSQDLLLYTMPEFNYFTLPREYGTGSSLMPQKNNPDVLELVRAKTSSVIGYALTVTEIVRALPSGYNRDVQETKEPFLDGLAAARSCLRVMRLMIAGLQVNAAELARAFTPAVFATDRALELVADGVPFRDAYHYVKHNLRELERADPRAALARKTHFGAPAGLDLRSVEARIRAALEFSGKEKRAWRKAIARLLGVAYPLR
jgi:argininosuccinate lyase